MQLAEQFWPYLGHWNGVEQLAASPTRTAGPARASLVLKLDVAATVVLLDYRRVREDGAETTAHGVFQAAGDEVVCWLFDSSGRSPRTAVGRFGDDGLRLRSVGSRGALEHHLRLFDADRLTYRVVPAGHHPDDALLAGRYQRVSTQQIVIKMKPVSRSLGPCS